MVYIQIIKYDSWDDPTYHPNEENVDVQQPATWLVMFPDHLKSLTAKPKRLLLKMEIYNWFYKYTV